MSVDDPCPGCTGIYDYRHADGCVRRGDAVFCECRGPEVFRHDEWCTVTGALTRWPVRERFKWPRRRWGR